MKRNLLAVAVTMIALFALTALAADDPFVGTLGGKATAASQAQGQSGAAAQAQKQAAPAGADPVKIDPKHYRVEFENDAIRVLRIKLGPHEKTPSHSHPASVVVNLTDTASNKAGDVTSGPAQTHAGENNSDRTIEVIQIELKGRTLAK